MENFKKLCKNSLAITKINLLRHLRDIRCLFVLCVTVILIVHYVKPYLLYAIDSGADCTFCMLPTLFNSTTISVGAPKTLLHIGLILLLCDAPFSHAMTAGVVLRGGRRGWWISGCLTVLLISFLYMSFISLVSSLILLPAHHPGNSWGKVFSDFRMQGRLGVEYPHIQISAKVTNYLYPYGAQLYTFVTGCCSFVLVGLIMYLISLISDNVIYGLSAAGFLVMIDPVIKWVEDPYWYWMDAFSPVGWCSTDHFAFMDARFFLTPVYVGIAFSVTIIGFICLIAVFSKRSEIMAGREGL